jgi:hypothetical protein
VGLSAAALSALVEAAVRLGLKAEEALREVQTARQSLRVFLLWLLDTMQHHHAKEEAGGANPPPAPKGGGGGFRHVRKHVQLLLSFLRRAPLPLPPGAAKPGNAEAIVGVQVAAYFREGPLALRSSPTKGPGKEKEGDEEEEEDELASLSLRTQAQALRAAFEAVFRRPLDALRGQLGPARLLRLPAPDTTSSTITPPPAPAFYPPLSPPPDPHGHGLSASVLCALVSPTRATLLALDPTNPTAAPTAAVAIQPPPGRRWAQAALYGPVPLVPSQNEEAMVLLARGVSSTSSGRAAAELWKLPLTSLLEALTPLPLPLAPPSSSSQLAGGGGGGGGGRESALLLGLQGREAVLPLSAVGGAKGRELSQMAPEALRLAVTGSRGVATVTSRANYLTLLDLEEDEEEEEEEEEEDGAMEEEEDEEKAVE